MFNTILVPVDGSQASQNALGKAVEIQKYCKSDLIILTVFRHQSLLEGSLSMIKVDDAANVIDDVQRSYSKEVAEAAKAMAIEMGSENPRAFVKRGPLARTIVSFAKDHEADLIILGTKGTGGNEQFLLGSVSHKVTGMSDIPVLVI